MLLLLRISPLSSTRVIGLLPLFAPWGPLPPVPFSKSLDRRALQIEEIAVDQKVPRTITGYVEPAARGLGIGSRLVGECVRFARQAGYKRIVLWTQSELDAARHIYKQVGFRVVRKKRHHSFSKDLVAETWELRL
jgi:GNAT superfamily N-acetyltransferase